MKTQDLLRQFKFHYIVQSFENNKVYENIIKAIFKGLQTILCDLFFRS